MKKLLNPLFALAIVATTFVACNNDDYDYEAEREKIRQQEQELDNIFSAEAVKIKEYALANFDTPQEDTLKYRYQVLDKTIKRGLWYEIVSEPTDDSYEYKLNSSRQVIYPKVKLKYTAKLLDGTVVESDLTGSDYDFNQTSKIINSAWAISFIPYSIKLNGDPIIQAGLTKDGLKKGSIIRVISPSPWAYGATKTDKIPANSPLVYEFEVLSIQ
ncbi:hypothetical protein FAZ15_08040 [Sphingobacterium olei]|uniref:Peptidyl-prolyl cis-trans isomerase n=1 Tax=Sphingobacterium olei TaxID=2571155 RepID=A0A4U0P1K6_9SPHI|nr:FKBP-type peptidyl-prolyl cis-trans isomerase [Sphingobacterium olei]TJZ61147.1 hypothetical protein FAZ15_08040 [Sphingobacterium olei]